MGQVESAGSASGTVPRDADRGDGGEHVLVVQAGEQINGLCHVTQGRPIALKSSA